ncbi:MAG: glycosyltransferase family 4 protein [Fibrella sp.]|nr:glycosyltransferase family 4 protein [Armatimonadota bacterium]
MSMSKMEEVPKERLRIAFVVNHINLRGGQERHAVEHINRFSQRHDVHVFTSELNDVAQERLAGVTIIPVPLKPFPRYFFEFRRKTSKAIRDAGTFDIIHTTGGIVEEQNFVAIHYCHKGWEEVLRTKPQARRGFTPYHKLNLLIAAHYERRACANPATAGLSACSGRTADNVSRFYGTAREKIQVVYNGADPARFHPDKIAFREMIRTQYGVPLNSVLFLFVGEYQRKGLNTVLEAMAKIKTNTPFHLLAVGRGNVPNYMAQAQALGVSDRVTFAGPTSDIEKVFGASDVFVFPTLYEPFGMVILEAMFTQLPVITSRVAGASELIQHGKNGFLVDDVTDPVAIAAQMDTVLAMSPEQRESLGVATRESVLFQTWDRAVGQTETAYFDALERQGQQKSR